MEKFYSTKEAANFLGVSVRTFKRLRQKGIVSPDKKGTNNSVFYSETQLMKLPRVVTSSDTSGVNLSSGDTQAVPSGDKIAVDTTQVVTQAVSSSDKIAVSNLVGWLKSIGKKWRGLAVSTLQHFHCGFANSRVIIPYNQFHYLARAIHNGESDPKKHHGSKSVFNISAISLDAPTLIFEGEIDVMSIWQATTGAVSAIAVGGIGEYKMLVRELNKIYEHSETKPKFIVLFDNDDKDGKNAGQDGAKIAVTALLLLRRLKKQDLSNKRRFHKKQFFVQK